MNGEINEKYVEHLTTLHNKIAYSQKNKSNKILSSNDIDPELEKLKIKVTLSFFLFIYLSIQMK